MGYLTREFMDLILLIVAYFFTSIIIAILAVRKQLSWVRAILLSVFLTPFAGAIYLNRSSVHSWYEPRYKCSRCDFSFTEPLGECPHCKSEGHQVVLKKTMAKMT
ncbi:MAG TPA: hypothetical protein DCR43_06750 [Bacteroidales bacterium]|nr:MAG: hypothetical protein A2X11_16225 [Bacteroidetes bacterium GWE2_42_24]OFY29184.1 MAG: hypothetical protein A2X09_05610 [Bacteroidetes bacterium GWF2_43_11]HAQ65534.1 hypothetical protein [Bacteroidales bacterium]HBZ66836.1 hypothetical protein [Bacteroidales bacterium]